MWRCFIVHLLGLEEQSLRSQCHCETDFLNSRVAANYRFFRHVFPAEATTVQIPRITYLTLNYFTFYYISAKTKGHIRNLKMSFRNAILGPTYLLGGLFIINRTCHKGYYETYVRAIYFY